MNEKKIKIVDLKTNHIKNPIGYDLTKQHLSWSYVVEDGFTDLLSKIRVIVAHDLGFEDSVYESNEVNSHHTVNHEMALELEPRKRYYWKVDAQLESGLAIESEVAYFETGKLEEAWVGQWIGIEGEECANPLVRREINIEKEVKSARLYITGLGLYECYLNGQYMNDGYLQPGFNSYKLWQQYQTMDVTESLDIGLNVLGVMLGDGWYKGRFGVNGGYENNFGENYHILCELHIQYADGSSEVIGSDEMFKYHEGPVGFANIYDGEILDMTKDEEGWMLSDYDDSQWRSVKTLMPESPGKLGERFSLPVVAKEKLKVKAVLKDPEGNLVLDVGQNVTGWLTFKDTLNKGEKVTCLFAEHMQEERLCRENLLTANATFTYTSDGKGRIVRPHFTYYGFRYIQVSGMGDELDPDNFEIWCLYSDMPMTGYLETGNHKVNKFIQNAVWSQKDNFLEHPTDCPQRSERLGWTGDAQMYFKTAAYNMFVPAFFRKYMKDINEEQMDKNGWVPFIVPKIKGRGFDDNGQDTCSAAWSDIATIVPWHLYEYYGDKSLLDEQFPGMKAWVDYIIGKDKEDGSKYLWQTGFHFGDWLALDNPEPGPFGMTPPHFIASCYYYYSTYLLSKAAKVLGKEETAEQYRNHAEKVKSAITEAYFSEGIVQIDTQTAYILAIYMDLVSSEDQMKNGEKLALKIASNDGHLDTGFVGTPYICLALSKVGLSSVAYDLLLNEDFPSWIDQVNKGATTVWEAWDALDSDRKLNGEPSLNHYVFGSVLEWLYGDVCGIKPIEGYPGFERVHLSPKPDPRLGKAKATFESSYGTYEIHWKYLEDARVSVDVSIPYTGSARLTLAESDIDVVLNHGKYHYEYEVTSV